MKEVTTVEINDTGPKNNTFIVAVEFTMHDRSNNKITHQTEEFEINTDSPVPTKDAIAAAWGQSRGYGDTYQTWKQFEFGDDGQYWCQAHVISITLKSRHRDRIEKSKAPQ